MKIMLKVSKLTMENGNAVVKLTPTIDGDRGGDSVEGELFLTTTEANMIVGMDDVIEIDFTTEEPTV